ncbi:MAG: calcium/sodium antiporter [Planctomycetota bacterium]
MDTVIDIMFLVIGMVLLWKSAELLVSSAVELARHLGISPLVIGLTVVAMGTSTPEIAASIAAALKNAGNIAIGNAYGSNIANLALVGGLCALVRPINVKAGILKREMPIMFMAALLLWPIVFNGHLSRLEGILLLMIFVALMTMVLYLTSRDKITDEMGFSTQSPTTTGTKSFKLNLFFTLLGFAGLALGADLTVRGAVSIGQQIGISTAVIGLTIIAIGTSLPELITSMVAIVKAQDDISVGNLVGSNIFNSFFVVGAAGSIRPFSLDKSLAGTNFWIMIIVTAVFIAIAAKGKKIGRLGGAFLFSSYVLYIVYLYTAGS